MTATSERLGLIPVHDAVVVLAGELAIPALDAIPLLIVSGIPTVRIDGRVRLHRGDVTAYTRHLAEQAASARQSAEQDKTS
jgi:hypothetical protein